MSKELTNNFVGLFSSRLTTLGHILDISERYFNENAESILGFDLIDDMLPFGAQIAYTCDQPCNFSLWCRNQESSNLSPELDSLTMARDLIERTKSQLEGLELKESKFSEIKRINIGGDQYLELEGINYIQDFLIPNFYFHLVTAYNIMRMKGVPLGKVNYNSHLAPFIRAA
ncbi:DUF1993 domain-containing protein [Exilibacterium tricleocarpae]|uniref:DUF1993 domain-containing protein n=1 Tax=Exilibacterium tricleocarpae TaxID=2591008 RepID=A0A545SXD4_9GAMM|nr:DUF1993 domain-containing protein [Exilibacterium tricleocarpae]TQV69609.1 DUF1993 domain-containing protein [Exilibacterium tricleocarpae]